MTSIELKIEGMSCNHCVMAVKKELTKTGIEKFDVQMGSAKVDFDEAKIQQSQIENAIEEAGYKVVKE